MTTVSSRSKKQFRTRPVSSCLTKTVAKPNTDASLPRDNRRGVAREARDVTSHAPQWSERGGERRSHRGKNVKAKQTSNTWFSQASNSSRTEPCWTYNVHNTPRGGNYLTSRPPPQGGLVSSPPPPSSPSPGGN